MAAVSASAAALSSSPSWQDPLGSFKSLMLTEEYEQAEKSLLDSAETLHIIQKGEDGKNFLGELLESDNFLVLLKTTELFLKHGITGKYYELCQMIAITWLGDPVGYFKLQEIAQNEAYVKYAEDMRGHRDDKTYVEEFFGDLLTDIEFIQNNPFLFASLKKLHAGALELTDISFLVETNGIEAALQDCLQYFGEYMQPHQIGALCQRLSDQINHFQEYGMLMPKPDPTESDKKV